MEKDNVYAMSIPKEDHVYVVAPKEDHVYAMANHPKNFKPAGGLPTGGFLLGHVGDPQRGRPIKGHKPNLNETSTTRRP